MRALTKEEKAQSWTARKQANAVLSKRRAFQLCANQGPPLAFDAAQREALVAEFDSLRDIPGAPVLIVQGGLHMTVNYDLLRRMEKSLRKRIADCRIEINADGAVLVMSHSDPFRPKNHGTIELRAIPSHKAELLTDLPIINL